jgi:hypothetical protein
MEFSDHEKWKGENNPFNLPTGKRTEKFKKPSCIDVLNHSFSSERRRF